MRGSSSIAAVSMPASASAGTRVGSAKAPAVQTSSAPRGISARTLGLRRLHGEHDPGAGQRGGGIGGDLGPGGGQFGIRQGGRGAGARLDRDRQAEPDQPLHGIRRHRDAGFVIPPFLQHRQAHVPRPPRSIQAQHARRDAWVQGVGPGNGNRIGIKVGLFYEAHSGELFPKPGLRSWNGDRAMDTLTKVSDTGKLNLPAQLRRQVGLDRGGPVLVRVEDGELRIRTVQEAMRRLQQDARRIFAASGETVDRFLTERREDDAG